MNEKIIKEIITQVINDYNKEIMTGKGTSLIEETKCRSENPVPVETSARHVHLSQEDLEMLFGKGYTLTKKKDISQPGQYLCEERVSLIGPKGKIDRVAVLGPVRKHTQIEISLTDSRLLGVKAPVRLSGDLANSADLFIQAGDKMICANKSVIVAQNHLHLSCEEARLYDLKDGQKIKIKMDTIRPITFDDVIVRVSDKAKLSFHIDYDEGNACGFVNGDLGYICRENACSIHTANRCMTSTNYTANESKVISSMKSSESALTVTDTTISEKTIKIKGKLLTESMLYDALKEDASIVLVENKAIITPLAHDYAKHHNMKIRFM